MDPADVTKDTKEEIVTAASAAIFGNPLVTNIFRGVIAEAIVATAIPDWKWVAADYSPYDFIHPSGVRLEVKQSALKQSWETAKPSVPSWDIAPRAGTYAVDGKWTPAPGRNAEIYVFCLHRVFDESADHRDPAQWQFFVVAAGHLPATKRLGLATASRLAGAPVTADRLSEGVGRVLRSLMEGSA